MQWKSRWNNSHDLTKFNARSHPKFFLGSSLNPMTQCEIQLTNRLSTKGNKQRGISCLGLRDCINPSTRFIPIHEIVLETLSKITKPWNKGHTGLSWYEVTHSVSPQHLSKYDAYSLNSDRNTRKNSLDHVIQAFVIMSFKVNPNESPKVNPIDSVRNMRQNHLLWVTPSNVYSGVKHYYYHYFKQSCPYIKQSLTVQMYRIIPNPVFKARLFSKNTVSFHIKNVR